MKKTICLFIAALFLASGAASQSVTPVVISSAGDFSSNSAGSIAWTIGEPVSDTYNSSGKITTMGFHQPVLDVIEMITEFGKNGNLAVYPNPVRDILHIDFANMKGIFDIELSDAAGRIITRMAVNSEKNSATVDLHIPETAAGVYLLKVQGSEVNAVIKINKVN